jgi:hypothetical protein
VCRCRCQDDWKLAFNAFSIGTSPSLSSSHLSCSGIPLFLAMMAQVGWVVFWDHSSRTFPSACVSAIACITLAFWILHTRYKWANFLKKVREDATLFINEPFPPSPRDTNESSRMTSTVNSPFLSSHGFKELVRNRPQEESRFLFKKIL